MFLTDNEAGLRGTMEFGRFGGAIFNDAADGASGLLGIVDGEIRQSRALRSGGGIFNEGTIGRFATPRVSVPDVW